MDVARPGIESEPQLRQSQILDPLPHSGNSPIFLFVYDTEHDALGVLTQEHRDHH